MADREIITDMAGKGRMNNERRSGTRGKALIALGVALAVVAVATAGVYLGRDGLWPPAAPSGPAATGALGEHNTTHMSLPLSSVGRKAGFYEYSTSGTTVRFFVVKDQNGTIHAAFDASPMDAGRPAGFRQSGDAMVHKATNMSVPIADITAGACSGGICHPAYLPCMVDGDDILFSKASLMMGASLFRPRPAPAVLEDLDSSTVAIPFSSLGTTAAWFEYNISGADVRFFAVLDSRGNVRTAFDECPMCYDVRMGFRQEGTMMMENCCEMPFPIDGIAPGVEGCHPEYLPSRLDGGRVLVSKADLLAGAYLFGGRTPEPPVVVDHNLTHVAIPLGSIGTTAAFYEYDISGAVVRFFAVKDQNGTVHTALDACPKCWKKHAGFLQNGSVMVEQCCKMPFPIANITYDGCNLSGCHPAFLPSRVEGDIVTMAKSALAAGRYMFLPAGGNATVENVNLTTVAIPLGSVSARATWYEYGVSGGLVRFFAVKDGNGTVHTAMDICPKCSKKRAGFRQDGEAMTENCCNMPFAIGNITFEGCNRTGCRPAFLASRVEGDRVMIAKSALAAGAYMFRTANETLGVEKYNATHIAIASQNVTGAARWFEHAVNGTVVRFFAVRDGNGTAHLSLDSCPKCWKKHAGFRQDGNLMVENCCNMGYPLENITAAWCANRTGCRPAFLPSVEEGGKIFIAIADLEAGSWMFQMGRR